MSTTFPTSIQTFTNPVGSNLVTSPDHAGLHTNINDTVAALQTKVGINGSTDTNSLDYKVNSVNNRGQLNVISYGADPTGVADSTAAFQAALDDTTSVYVYVPPGQYNLTTINLHQGSSKLIGAGIGCTVLYSTTADQPLITVNASIGDFEISGFHLYRGPTAVSGGDGIRMLGQANNPIMSNLIITKQYIGMNLDSCGKGIIQNCLITANLDDGILMSNSISHAGIQWSINDVLVELNSGYGVQIAAVGPSADTSLGTFIQLDTFANTKGGVYIHDDGVTGLASLRLYDSFLGNDGGIGCIYISTHGANHAIRNCYIEGSGMGATGPNLATPQTATAPGITIENTNKSAYITDTFINGCSYSGIQNNGAIKGIQVIGCSIVDNGQAGTASSSYGINNTTGTIVVTGCRIGNDTTSAQTIGINAGTAAIGLVIGNNLRGNASAATQGFGTASTIANNLV